MIQTLSLIVRVINKHGIQRNDPDSVRPCHDDTVRVINKHRNDPDPVTDTVRVINKNRNDPDPVIDTIRVINKNRNDPNSVTDTVRVIN